MSRIVCWFSCGAASAVATKLAIADNKGDKELVIAYTEVKEEHPDNKRFLKECEEWFGQKIEILGNDFYDRSIYRVFEKNYMRTPKGAPCTRALKKQIRERFEKPTDRQVFGYTADRLLRARRADAGNRSPTPNQPGRQRLGEHRGGFPNRVARPRPIAD